MNSDILHSGLPPAHDRMMTTCFLAALFHAIVILGVTFSGPDRSDAAGDAPALEVVMINANDGDAGPNKAAHYLSDRNRHGSGNTQKADRALIPKSSPLPLERIGAPDGTGQATTRTLAEDGDDELIATESPAVRVRYFAAPTAAEELSELALLLQKQPDLGMTSTEDGVQLRLRGAAKNQLWIQADTRESEVAVYLDAWRRKIERVGTVNFPNAVRRRQLSGTPIIDVTIGATGRLLKAQIRRTSGEPEIDEAAMRILKLAAPYDSFPRALGEKHDEIRIAYEWQFLGGADQGSSVFY